MSLYLYMRISVNNWPYSISTARSHSPTSNLIVILKWHESFSAHTMYQKTMHRLTQFAV